MISMRVPANNPLWIAQISNFGFFDAIADKDETLVMDAMMSNVQCPMLFNIDTNANESCLHALLPRSV